MRRAGTVRMQFLPRSQLREVIDRDRDDLRLTPSSDRAGCTPRPSARRDSRDSTAPFFFCQRWPTVPCGIRSFRSSSNTRSFHSASSSSACLREPGASQHGARAVNAVAVRDQLDQERAVAVAPEVVLEVRDFPLDVKLLEEDVTDRHPEGAVLPLMERDPFVGDLGGLAEKSGEKTTTFAPWCRASTRKWASGVRVPRTFDPTTAMNRDLYQSALSPTSVCSPQISGDAGGRSQYQS